MHTYYFLCTAGLYRCIERKCAVRIAKGVAVKSKCHVDFISGIGCSTWEYTVCKLKKRCGSLADMLAG